MTVAEAAKLWGVNRSRVHVWIKQGRVPSTRIDTPQGGYFVIPDGTLKPTPRPPGMPKRT